MAFNSAERFARRKAKYAADREAKLAAEQALDDAQGIPKPKRVLNRTDRPYKPTGNIFHKANCKCKACAARHWDEKAVIRAAGAGGDANPDAPGEVIRVDVPQIVAGKLGQLNTRERIGQWLTLRYANPQFTMAQIAEKMGISRNTLYGIISKATKEGWLRFDDPMDRIENEIIPKTLDNLSHFLDSKDRTVTIETAKGTIFKQFQESKGVGDNKPMILALKIETAAPIEQSMVVEGNIVGKAKQISGE